MDVNLLINSTVRQVTVLIAQLATSGGVRAPLAQVANQVFVELAHELEAQGVSRKVSADMFGMALRAYIRKVRRLTESATESEQTLWQAVLTFIKQGPLVTRQRVFTRFHRDGELEVSSILKDLCETGLVFCSGSGQASIYRAASDDELGQLSGLGAGEGIDELAWVFTFRSGPFTVADLAEQLSRSVAETQAIVDRLVAVGRVQRDGVLISAEEFVIPLGTARGWEASVFDHLQAVVQTICQRLQESTRGGDPSGVVGGSTYTFDVWPGHPHYEEVKSLLALQRERLGNLHNQVEAYGRLHARPDEFEEVVTYVGQCVRKRESARADDNETP